MSTRRLVLVVYSAYRNKRPQRISYKRLGLVTQLPSACLSMRSRYNIPFISSVHLYRTSQLNQTFTD